ncbi:MAG: DNA primase [Bryobacteraceae bacterium]|jgi:DNA primase
MDFKEQLKSSVDIVDVIGEYVRLKKSGPQRYSGLCPFHNEKTPSFSVHAARQFYKCFGCGEGGDVFSFVQKIEGVTFYEALKTLAERHGIAMPKRSLVSDEQSKLRDAVFQMHELALESYRANLRGPAGEMAREYLARRGVAPAVIEQFGLGYSDRAGRTLLRSLEKRFSPSELEASGLVRKREDGGFYDYFRNRLMFPIHGETGKVIGFGGRALAADDNPKYLNSPETPIYTKSHVLYNLHRAKEAIRKEDRTILVEGYMDAIGVSAAGFPAVVASCGTSLTELQVKALKRHSERIVVNFDPDAPGAAAAERSINLLLQEGMYVRIMSLDGDLDPDEYCKERGAEAYAERLNAARGYFHWLADRARARHDVRTTEGRIAVLKFLMPAMERISDRLERMTVANDVASYIGVEGGMVLDSFRKAVADRRAPRMETPRESLRADEKGLLNVLLSDARGKEELLTQLGSLEILNRIATQRIYQAIASAHAGGAPVTFDGVMARLDAPDQNLLAELALSEDAESMDAGIEYGRQCVESLRRSGGQARRAQLKGLIKEAERAGNFAEALRLAGELQALDKAAAARG